MPRGVLNLTRLLFNQPNGDNHRSWFGFTAGRISSRSPPLLFRRLREQTIKPADAGWVLMRFNELRQALQLRRSGELTLLTDDELKAVVSLLSGPGVV